MNNVLKYWTADEFEISSYKWNLSEKINKSFKTSGSDNTGLCTYTYNELGFRSDSINKDGFKVMSIGCSMTEGIGVSDYATWPYLFTKQIPNGVNHNFGMSGRSNDYISRCLLTFYDVIKPDLVLIMYTSSLRREIFTTNGGIEPFHPTHVWGFLEETAEGKLIQDCKLKLQNDNEDLVNWYKNHLIIKYFLKEKNCNWIWNGWMRVPEEIKELNRFDGTYKAPWKDLAVDKQHPGPKHNIEYSKELLQHILTYFPNYLPRGIKINNESII